MMNNEELQEESKVVKWRNFFGFWILGLCNNFGYVVMLTAAYDILGKKGTNTVLRNETIPATLSPGVNRTDMLIPECHQISTGAVLLANILPSVILKMIAPLFITMIPYFVRVAAGVLCAMSSFLIVAFANPVWLSLLGVGFGSFGSGLGELTFLSLTACYTTNTLSGWSSGTGAAGVAGALSYAGLRAAGLSAQSTILIMLVVPVIMGLTYLFLLTNPREMLTMSVEVSASETSSLIQDSTHSEAYKEVNRLSLIQKVKLIPPLFKYMVPLTIVYFAVYFINQAVYELIYFDDISLSIADQYRWYQVIFQIGVCLTRSSASVLRVHNLWALAALEVVNMVLFFLQIFFQFIPNVWLVFILIFWEGVVGGFAYLNTFYRISEEVAENRREFSMGTASMSDSIGTAVAGGVALPMHNWFCTLHR